MDLVRVYDPGNETTPADRIYLFGFSRGAFTVRTLAGLIAKCGVLDRDKLPDTDTLHSTVRKAYSTYRQSYRTLLGSILNRILVGLRLRRPDADAMAEFRANSIPSEVSTSSALGHSRCGRRPVPHGDIINAVFHRFKFLTRSNHKVDQAVHLSIDGARGLRTGAVGSQPNVEQVWFGRNSNVGGVTQTGISSWRSIG
jgi:hypothetical protein